MKIVLFPLFLILFLPQVIFAQSDSAGWTKSGDSFYAYTTVLSDPMKARFYKLSNGLTVILSTNKKEPRLQCLFAIRSGSNSDPRNHTGLAHYLEHMLFKGTDKFGSLNWSKEKPLLDSIQLLYEKYNHSADSKARASIYRRIDQTSGRAARFAIANEYDKMMSALGAQGSNAFTWYEFTGYIEDIPSSAIDRYLTVQSERFRYPVFRLFHTELEAVYEEKNMSLDSDPDKVQETAYASLFPTHNYGQQTTIGTIEHLKNPSLTEIRNFYDNYYVPNNMAIIMCGDFDPDTLIRKVDHYFGYMQPKPVADYHFLPEQSIEAPVTKEVVGPDAEETNLYFRLPGSTDPRTAILMEALQSILWNGKAGLIDIGLNKKQLVLGASASVSNYRDYSVFELRGKPRSNQSLEQVRDLLLQEIEKIKNGDFDESLLKAVVANYKLSELQPLADNGYRANRLFDDFIIDRDQNWPQRVRGAELMNQLSKKDITDFVKEYFLQNYVCIFKRRGVDKNIIKVEKPPITPVEVNREAQSPFLKTVNSMPAAPVKPQWLDFTKDFQRMPLQHTDLLYVQNGENAIFKLSYRFNMGSWNERKLALAAQYLQYLGTENESAEAISREFYGLACSYGFSVNEEYTTVWLTGLQENMGKSISLLEKLISTCKADDTAFNSLKARILKSRADSKLNKNAILRGLESYAIYGPQNPFNNQVGNEELNALSAKELTDLMHGLFHYKHTIIYYGPLELTSAENLIKQEHPLPSSFMDFPAKHQFSKINQKESRVLFADYDMVQAEILWIRNTGLYDPSQTATIDLFNEYYGGGMGSVVFQTLRESRALAYGTYAGYNRPDKKDDRYTVIGYIGCQADKMKEAIDGMNELFNRMPKSEKLIETSRKSVKNQYETQRFHEDEVVYQWLDAQDMGLNKDIRPETYRQFDHLGFPDLLEFDKKYISGKPFTYCVLASEEKINMTQLSKYGKLRKLSLKEIFGY